MNWHRVIRPQLRALIEQIDCDWDMPDAEIYGVMEELRQAREQISLIVLDRRRQRSDRYYQPEMDGPPENRP